MSIPVFSPRAVALSPALFALLVAGLLAVGCSKPAEPSAPAANPAAKSAPTVSPAVAARRAADAEKEKARQSAAEMVPVETALVTRGEISAFLSFNSTLETESVVDIYPQTTGQVEALFVEEGKVVKEGEPLLKIDDRELRVDADEANGNYEHLKRNYARTQDLYQRKKQYTKPPNNQNN